MFDGFRVDGSVLTLAEYALLSLYLDGFRTDFAGQGGKRVVYEALGLTAKGGGANSPFCRIGRNLLAAVQQLEGVRGHLPPAVSHLSYSRGGARQQSLLGGRMLYYSLAAIIELESAGADPADLAKAEKEAVPA